MSKKQEIVSVKATLEMMEENVSVPFDELIDWEQKMLTKLVLAKDLLIETIEK